MQLCKGAGEHGRLHPELQTLGSLPIILSLGPFPTFRSVCFLLILRNSTTTNAMAHRKQSGSPLYFSFNEIFLLNEGCSPPASVPGSAPTDIVAPIMKPQ